VVVRRGIGRVDRIHQKEKITRHLLQDRGILATPWPAAVLSADEAVCDHSEFLVQSREVKEGKAMNLITFIRVVVTAVLFSMPGWSQAATYSLYASLNGGQEVPINASPGIGTGILTYDDVANQLNWNITFSGLLAGTTASHFHGPAVPGVNAGVQVTIPLGTSFGATSGTLIGMATLTATQETQLLSDLWYINIHTSLFPGGEIRGQVQVVPLPAAAWLFGSGLLTLVAWTRRRRHTS
jgi:CHRD domain